MNLAPISLSLLPLLGVALTASLLSVANAGVITKADNTSLLDLGASWALGTAPTSTDVATWSGTYNTAGSLSAAFTASTPVSWQGIKVGALSGTAAGLVSIGSSGAAVTGSSVTIGSSGIDMSTANQDLVINSATTALTGATQTWDTGTARNLRFGTSGTGSANANLDGTVGTVITVQGTGVVDANQGGASGYADAAGFAGFNGKWIVSSGATLRGIRNGSTAWGTSTAADAITLNGGTLAVGGISGTQGNWTWNSKMTLADGTASNIDNQLFSGTNRYLKLEGAIAGASLNTCTLTFKNTNTGQMNNDEYGYILTGANTFTGGMTINANTFVRIGGSNAGTADSNAGNNGSLASALAITNNSVLRLTRNDTWTLGNNISGSGQLKVGGTLGTTTAQVVTASGTNNYTGATTVVNGELKISGSTNTTSGNVTVGTVTAGTLTVQSTGSLTTTGILSLGNGIVGNAFNVNSGGSVSVGSISNAWNTTYTIDGTLASAGAWSISTNATTGIGGTSGTLSAASLSVSNNATANFSNTGTLSLTGNLSTGSATAGHLGTFNQSAGTINAVGLVLGTASSTATQAYALIGGRINLGTSGISSLGTGTRTVSLGAGTVGAKGGNWSSSLDMSLTNAVTGTTFNTLDSVDGTTARTITLSGNLGSTGKLIKDGAGTILLSGTNTFTGGANITGGTLALSGSGSLADSTAVSLTASGTVFDIAGITGPATEKIGSLSGSSGSMVHLGGNTLEFGDATNTSFSGVADGTGGGFKKVGSGIFTLNGTTTNTYTGTTSLVGGTLLLGNHDVLPNAAPFSLSGGTTFSTGGFNETTGSFSLAGNAVIDLVGGTSVLTFSNIDSWSGVLSVWNWNGTPNTPGGPGNTRLIFSAGSLTSEQLSNVHFYSGGNGSQEVGSGGIFIGNELVAVPEPTSLSSSGMLVAWMLCGGRRRTKVQAHSAI